MPILNFNRNPKDWHELRQTLQHMSAMLPPMNFDAIVAPTTSDTISNGWRVGSLWFDTNADIVYMCTDAVNGIWQQMLGTNATAGGVSAGLDSLVDYLGVYDDSTGLVVRTTIDDLVAAGLGTSVDGVTIELSSNNLRRMALTGDVIAAAGSAATTLATVNANVGSFGTATQVATVTVNAKGLVTAASNTTIVPTTITVGVTIDSTCSVALFNSPTGDLAPKTSSDLTFNAFTPKLTCTGQLESGVATGTAPLVVASTTKVTNLNADLLDDKNTGTSGNTIPLLDGANTWSGTQTLGTTTKLQFLDATSFIQATSAGNVTLEAAALLTLGVAGTTEFGDGTLRIVRPQTDLKIDLGDGTHRFNDCYFSTESLNGKTVKYNDIATVGNGIPSIYAEINSTGLTANVAATDLLAAGSVVAGRYRITAYLVTTTAASVSSTMPNAQIVYTDSDSNTAVTLDVSPILGAAGLGQSGLLTANAVGTVFTGSVLIYAKVGVAIQYQTVNYASTAAGMAYALRITLERL